MGNTQYDIKHQIINHSILKNSLVNLEKETITSFVQVIEESDIGDWVAKINKVKNLQTQFLFNPQLYSVYSREMCGNSCIIKIQYPNYPYILMDQISNRQKYDKKFEENQIWYILFSLVECSNQFFKIQGNVGDIRPHNILFNEMGQLAIPHRFSWPCQLSNFEKSQFERIQTFLAPEEIDLLAMGKTYNNCNQILSQSFSIGLTLLSVIHLFDFSRIYDTKYFVMNLEELSRKIEEVQEQSYINMDNDQRVSYSAQLKNIIKRLCAPKPSQRLKSIEVYRWLLPFKQQIINFSQFKLKIYENKNNQIISSSQNVGRTERYIQNIPVKVNYPSTLNHIVQVNKPLHQQPKQHISTSKVYQRNVPQRNIVSSKMPSIDNFSNKNEIRVIGPAIKIEDLESSNSIYIPPPQIQSNANIKELSPIRSIKQKSKTTMVNNQKYLDDLYIKSAESRYPEDQQLLKAIDNQIKISKEVFPPAQF